MKFVVVVAAWTLLALVSGCDYVVASMNAPAAPKIVEIEGSKDGETFMACKGDIRILATPSGYQLDFIDAAGLNHLLYGIKKIHLTDIPKMIKSTVPYPEPELYNFSNSDHNLPTYSDGPTVHNGAIVVWPSGAEAKFVIEHDAQGNETKRHWESIWIRNAVCDPPT